MEPTVCAVYTSYFDLAKTMEWNYADREKLDKARVLLALGGHSIESKAGGGESYLFNGSYVEEQDAHNPDMGNGWSIKVFAISKGRLDDILSDLMLPRPENMK